MKSHTLIFIVIISGVLFVSNVLSALLSDEDIKKQRFLDKITRTTRVENRGILKDSILNVTDEMATTFFRLYKECKWDSLWAHYKKKSEYHNPHEEFEKSKFFETLNTFHDSCGTLTNAKLFDRNIYRFKSFGGYALSYAIEYIYDIKFTKKDTVLFLEIWTVENEIDNFKHVGYDPMKDED